MTLRDQVREFHQAFGQPVLDRPQVPSDDRVRLRLRLISEEFFELLRAAATNPIISNTVFEAETKVRSFIDTCKVRVDLPELADALADLDYVCEGTRLEFGIDGGPVADEVQRSNLAKVWPDGTVHKSETGKVLKPPSWSPPDIAGVLRAQGWEGE